MTDHDEKIRVLMIDDDAELGRLMAEYLEPEGFALTPVLDGQAGLEAVRAGRYQLVLLDVMLPRLNGFEVLRRLRAGDEPGASLPVLMLTARGDAVDRVVGLEVGADDYLPKPFDERELVARMRAILRRSRPAAAGGRRLQLGDLALDREARVAWLAGEAMELTGLEFDLLLLLLQSAGKLVTRDTIAHAVLHRKLLAFDRSIDTHISHLRRKLGPHPEGGERLRTVRGMGYIYTPPAA